MLVIYLHSDISKGFGGISDLCKPQQYQTANMDPSTTPTTTGIGTGDTQPRQRPQPPSGALGSMNVPVAPQKIVTKNISLLKNRYDTLHSHIAHRVLEGTVRGDGILGLSKASRLSPRHLYEQALMN